MKSKSAILTKINNPLELEEIHLPKLKRGQVLTRIAYSGVCRTQLNEMKGMKGEDKFLPHTLGHEGSGIVIEVGEGVKKVKKDDKVVITWIKAGGIDAPSTRYRRNDDSYVNSGPVSTFCEFAIISENRLVPISPLMPLKEAALLGCAFPTGAGMLMNIAKAKAGCTVAVFGVGGIGMSAIMTAKMIKAKTIIAVDKFDYKLQFAINLGATDSVNSEEINPVESIRNITDGKGVDFAIESSGKKMIMEQAFDSVRESGGHCVISGNLRKDEKISIDPFDLIKGKRISGSWGGGSDPDKDVTIYVDKYLSGDLNLQKLITHEYSLDEINEVFHDLDSGNIIRALIKI